MYLHRSVIGFALASTLALPASAAQASMRYDERTETYQIGGVAGDPASIWEGIRRFGPSAHGASRAGATTAETSWKPTIEKGLQGCLLKRVDVSVAVTMTLPAWSGRHRATPVQRKYWDCVAGTVGAHEKGQAQIWKETGHKIERELAAITDWMPCGQLNEVLKETAQRIEQNGRRQVAADDADGRHTRYDTCKIDVKMPEATADAKDPAEESDGAVASAATADASVATEPGSGTPPRLGSRLKKASGSMIAAANTSLWLMLWFGGALVAGMAGFVILMKRRLSQKDAAQVAQFKERSLLLRFARKVDRSTGGHISRTSLPDRIGVRRKAPPAHLRPLRR